MSWTRGFAIFDKHGRAFVIQVGDSNRLRLPADSSRMLGDVNLRRGYGHALYTDCMPYCTPVAQIAQTLLVLVSEPGAA